MFDAPGQSMDGDHLDLSYRDTSTWPRIGPGGLVASLWVSIGDPTVGPAVQLIKTSRDEDTGNPLSLTTRR